MSKFNDDFKAKMLGQSSFESQEQDLIPRISDEDILQTEELREEVAVTATAVDDVYESLTSLDTTASAVDTLLASGDAVVKAQPVDGDVVAAVANTVVADVATRLDTQAPSIDVDSDGSINDESMEGFMDWTKSVVGAVTTATGRFFTNLGATARRLRTDVSTLATRVQKARGFIKKRNGNGGKVLKLSMNDKIRLVVGEKWSQDMVGDTKLFVELVSSIIPIYVELHKRVVTKLQNSLVAKLGGGGASIDVFTGIVLDDLEKALEKILAAQLPAYLGNVRFAFDQNIQGNKLLSLRLIDVGLNSKSIVVHLDPLVSMTSEEAEAALNGLDEIIRKSMLLAENAADAAENSGSTIQKAITKLDSQNRPGETADGEDDYYSDLGIDFGAEYDLIRVLGRIEGMMFTALLASTRRVSTALTVIEESAFQD